MVVSGERIVEALFSCSTNKEAAAAVGLSESQLYARLRSVEIQTLIRAVNTELLASAAMSLREKTQRALDVVTEIMENEDAAEQVRLNACDIILRHADRIGVLAWKSDERQPDEDLALQRLDAIIDSLKATAISNTNTEVKQNDD